MKRLVVGALVAGLSATAHAQDSSGANFERKTVRVVRTSTPPTIDGRLDDAVWQDAEVITDIHQMRPAEGSEPSEPTEVYVLYDDDAFYIGARMHDSEPERIAAPTMRHGQGLGSDDRLVVIFDPFNTGRSGYRFETNANGVRHDALYQSIANFENAWSVIWEAAGSIDEQGWLAELAIPFKSLPFDPNSDTWGFNFGRGIRRRGEEMAWVSRNRSYNPSILGLASGLEGMDQGMGLDIVPSVSAGARKDFVLSTTDSNLDPSLDVFYRLTPSLNASLTINTDFSATEVDDRQVNLTRFGLFFPEKRDFFLNDSDLFEFGRISREGFNEENEASSGPSLENARPFFSRRLGLSSSGAPVDLNYGGKLSGRIGRWNIGTLAIRQDEFEDITASDVFVGRVTANVLAESAIGIIVTDGDPNSNLDNGLTGVDFRYLNSRLPGGRVFEADAWFQQSDTEGIDGADKAFGIGVQMPNNSGLRGSFGIKQIEGNFNPALGFVNRTDVRDTSVALGYTRYTGGELLQSFYTGIDAQRIELLDGGLQSEVFLARLIELESNSRDDLEVRYIATRETVAKPFTIYEDPTREVVISPGRYSFNEAMVGVSTGRQRTFSGEINYQWGDFYDGTRTNIGGDFRWNASRLFRLRLGYDWNDIVLPGGSFVSRLVRLTTEVTFSPTLSWVTLLQYDNDSEILGLNTRLHWIPTAGREGFIVINHDLQDIDRDNRFNSALADTTIKFNYTFRY